MWKAMKPGLHIFCSLLVKAITAVKFLMIAIAFTNIPLDFKGELQRQNKLISSKIKGRPKSSKMRPKSLKSAKPFSRYSTLKIEIWTILREKTTEEPIMLCFFRTFAKTEEQ